MLAQSLFLGVFQHDIFCIGPCLLLIPCEGHEPLGVLGKLLGITIPISAGNKGLQAGAFPLSLLVFVIGFNADPHFIRGQAIGLKGF